MATCGGPVPPEVNPQDLRPLAYFDAPRRGEHSSKGLLITLIILGTFCASDIFPQVRTWNKSPQITLVIPSPGFQERQYRGIQKSEDTVTLWDFHKVLDYAVQYAYQNKIGLRDMTITIVQSRHPLLSRVKSTYRDTAFRGMQGFGEAFPFLPGSFPVFLRYRSMAAGRVFLSFPAVSPAARNAGRPAVYAICRCVNGAKIFPHLCRKKARTSLGTATASPAQTRFPLRLAGRFFSGMDNGCLGRSAAQEPDSGFPAIPGQPRKSAGQSRFLFLCRLSATGHAFPRCRLFLFHVSPHSDALLRASLIMIWAGFLFWLTSPFH
jgi:hypothetical protein